MRELWVVYSSQRTYYVEGSEAFAERIRRVKAQRHAAVFRKRPATEEDRQEADTQDLEARER
jgi:hypothetical protein